ncbi:unnamed protein product [Camellia sinensis]
MCHNFGMLDSSNPHDDSINRRTRKKKPDLIWLRLKPSRIDRFILGFDWLAVFNFKCWGLPRSVSDHCPIIMKEDSRDWGPEPFRFINCWLLHSGFLSMVAKVWLEAEVDGWAGYSLSKKLGFLKKHLKEWNVSVFGSLTSQLKLAEEEFHQLEPLAESRELLAAEISRKVELRELIWKLSKRVEWFWLQKSRQDWALRGDKNTRYFHLMVKCRQNINLINSVVANGVVVDDPLAVKSQVWNHFKSAFSESWKVRPKIGGVFQILDGPQVLDLEKEFTESEVWSALKACDGNKAPGPDGFNLLAIRKCWKFMKGDIMLFFKEFFANGKLATGLISSIIALIPKTENPNSLNDFRPISLIGSMYKILAKVLSSRLKLIIPSIISPSQLASMGGGGGILS